MAAHVAELDASRVRERALAARILSAQEAERARVSRELHDETGQALTLVLVRLALIQEMTEQAEVRRELAGLRTLVADAIQGVQRLTQQLGPGVLDRLGLAAALERLAERVYDEAGLRVDLVLDREDVRIPVDVAVAVFRVAQEALTNVVRHARAQRATMVLEIDGDELRLVVSDRGIGFDAAGVRSRPSESIGLSGMAERVALVGGRFEVRSRPGGGTRVTARVPLGEGGIG